MRRTGLVVLAAMALSIAMPSAAWAMFNLPPGMGRIAVETTPLAGWDRRDVNVTTRATCLSPGENKLECYARDTNSELVRVAWDGANWSARAVPDSIQMFSDGTDFTPPSCLIDPDGITHCFVRGSDRALWHRWLLPSGQGGFWTSLGGGLTSGPSCSSPPGVRHLHCFARGVNGALWVIEMTNGGWSGWNDLGGQIAPFSRPACVTRNAGRSDCIVVDPSGRQQHLTFAGGQVVWAQAPGGDLHAQSSGIETPRCQLDKAGQVACYAFVHNGVDVGLERWLHDGRGWRVRDMGWTSNRSVPSGASSAGLSDVSCVEGNNGTFECAEITNWLGGGLSSSATTMRLIQGNPNYVTNWADVTPRTAGSGIFALECLSWGPGRLDCFASGNGAPLVHAYREARQAEALQPGARFRIRP